MTYTLIRLPDDYPEPLEAVVRGSLEPFLIDVHVMLGVVGPTIRPDHPPHLLGHSIALTLLSVVSSAAEMLYPETGTNRAKFVGVLSTYYPWNQAPASGLSKEEAAELLYKEFRNPLAHRAGIRPAGSPIMGISLSFPGASDPYQEISEIEQAREPPSGDTLNIDSAACHLEVKTMYWGVRKMLEAIAVDRGRWPDTIEWIQNHNFMR